MEHTTKPSQAQPKQSEQQCLEQQKPTKPDPFKRRDMVQWFSPGELVRAGIKAVLASLFGAYADKREVQALQAEQATQLAMKAAKVATGAETVMTEANGEPASNGSSGRDLFAEHVAQEVCDHFDEEDIWFDYIADLGDGFDATYTMARLLAEPTLKVSIGKKEYDTQRGRILVMGGDQVYPAATRDEYNNRLVGPYAHALTWSDPNENYPKLFAIPGNHDWYDGLTSFIRLFCQERWIGGWKTQQRRSYFAIRLPHNWWIWGIDIQLEADVDFPQIQYFKALAANKSLMPPGSKIILCIAEPSWVYTSLHEPKAYDNLAFFEKRIIHAYGHEHVVGLSGDLHTYARYERAPGEGAGKPGPRQRFIAGGGGAYLYPTHHLPDTITLPGKEAEEHYTTGRTNGTESRRSLFPNARKSTAISFGALLFAVKNISFSLLLGFIYLFFAWILQSASIPPALSPNDPVDTSFLHVLANSSRIEEVRPLLFNLIRQTPGSILLALVLLGGFIGMARSRGWLRWALGALHTAAHLLAMLLLMWMFVRFNSAVIDVAIGTWQHLLLFSTEMLVIGGFVGGTIIGIYLLLSHFLSRFILWLKRDSKTARSIHAEELFNCQTIPDYKHFLRFHINRDGKLTIYPIGVQTVCRNWRDVQDDPADADAWIGKPLIEPEKGVIADYAELIEQPITVDG